MKFNPLKTIEPGSWVRVTLVKSPISSLKRHKDGVRTLGLRKIRQSRDVQLLPAMLGIVRNVVHLLDVQPLKKEEV